METWCMAEATRLATATYRLNPTTFSPTTLSLRIKLSASAYVAGDIKLKILVCAGASLEDEVDALALDVIWVRGPLRDDSLSTLYSEDIDHTDAVSSASTTGGGSEVRLLTKSSNKPYLGAEIKLQSLDLVNNHQCQLRWIDDTKVDSKQSDKKRSLCLPWKQSNKKKRRSESCVQQAITHAERSEIEELWSHSTSTKPD